jgi:hypothetical protein
VKRHTFVVQVHPDGISTLENLSTHERVRIAELSAVGPQIDRWLAELGGSTASAATPPRSERGRSESTPG